jgi:hypothetical protein
VLHGVDDVLPAALDVILGTDGDRFDLLLRTHDMLERGAEFDGKPSVRNQNDADHSIIPRAT